jgi:chromosome segregation protein
LDRELDTVQQRRQGVAGGIESSRSRIEADERLIRELEEAEALSEDEIQGLNDALLRLREEREALGSAMEEAAHQCGKVDEELRAAARGLEELSGGLRDSEARMNAQQSELIEIINRISRNRNDLAGIKHNSRSAALRCARLQVEEKELVEQRAQAEIIFKEKRTRRGGLETLRESSARELEDTRERLHQSRRMQEALKAEQLEAERELARCESHAAVLQRYQETYQGFLHGVQLIMAEAGRAGADLTGIHGVVAGRIKAPAEYARALEAALGHALQFILIRSPREARAAVAFLNGRAEAYLLPCEGLAEPPPGDPPRGDGLVGRALDLVSYEPDIAVAARYLLADTYFVTDLNEALKLIQECRPGVRLVTCAGELLVAGGPLKTAAREREPSPLIPRGEELARVMAQAESLRGARDGVLRRIAAAEENCRRLVSAYEASQEKARRAEVELAEARIEDARAAASLEQTDAEREAVQREAAELEVGMKEASRRGELLEKETGAHERREQELRDSLASMREAVERGNGEREERQAAVTELKVRLAGAREKQNGLTVSLERLRREIETSEGALRSRREQKQRGTLRRGELVSEIESLRASIAQLMSERDATDTDAREREQRKAALYERQKLGGERLKEAVASMEVIKDETGRLEVVLAEHRAERKRIIDWAMEQYAEDLAAVARDQGITRWDEIAAAIDELKEKLKRIGPVNLAALEEHDELAARLKFLTEQETDLLSAKDSLVKAIHRINVETTRMFSETFEAIKANFKALFKELFGGGTTDLLLEEGAHILEAGINIVARPPGKKLQSISLLSGGEKALTAVALLFAIFKVRPSPFCVLDEIDAPLDESNINRFLEMLGHFLQESQFIIVTHNKRTISMADVMYGITMEESGVSKVVSVKFGRRHDRKSSKEHIQPTKDQVPA